MTPPRVVVWYSCGVTSAVAAHLTIKAGHDPIIAYCASTLSTEHPDNERFIADCEQWFNRPIRRLYSKKYTDIYDVFRRTKWLVGPRGARCTTELKKLVRRDFEDLTDLQVFGFSAGEQRRADRFRESNPEVRLSVPLIDQGVTKAQAIEILKRAGIELPIMYRLGYRNNNCIGCVKGGQGYWNKIRDDFPEVFARTAAIEREMGTSIHRHRKGPHKGDSLYLDELPRGVGRYEQEPDIQCGIWCGQQNLFEVTP